MEPLYARYANPLLEYKLPPSGNHLHIAGSGDDGMSKQSREINLGRRRQDTPLLGYSCHNTFYSGAKWRNLRAYKLSIDPFCEICRKAGRIVPATCVDHIIPIMKDESLALEYSNLQSLCHSCHSTKTVKENIK